MGAAILGGIISVGKMGELVRDGEVTHKEELYGNDRSKV